MSRKCVHPHPRVCCPIFGGGLSGRRIDIPRWLIFPPPSPPPSLSLVERERGRGRNPAQLIRTLRTDSFSPHRAKFAPSSSLSNHPPYSLILFMRASGEFGLEIAYNPVPTMVWFTQCVCKCMCVCVCIDGCVCNACMCAGVYGPGICADLE